MVSFSESAEFKQRSNRQVWRFELVGPVGRLYRAYFLRRPDDRGLRHWINTGMPLGAVSDTLAHSIEFLNRYGTLTNEEFVQLVYRNVLGRRAEDDGYRYWLDQLRRRKPRGNIMLGFSNSIEFIRKVESLTP